MNTLTKSLLIILVALSQSRASAQECPGCSDISVAPTPPPAATFEGTLPPSGFTITVATAELTITVTRRDGICAFDNYGPPVNVKVCEPLYSCAPHVKIDLNLTDSHPVGTIDWDIVMSGTVCNVGLPSATMTARGSEMLSVFDQQLEVRCGTQCTISTNYSITASWDPPIPFTPVQHFGTSLLALSGGPIKCEGCERLAVPTGQ